MGSESKQIELAIEMLWIPIDFNEDAFTQKFNGVLFASGQGHRAGKSQSQRLGGASQSIIPATITSSSFLGNKSQVRLVNTKLSIGV